MDLPAVVERFAIDFDSLPELVEGLSASRMLIASGVLVRAFAVFGLLMADDSIELTGVELDMTSAVEHAEAGLPGAPEEARDLGRALAADGL